MPIRLADEAGVEVVVAHHNNLPALTRLLDALRLQTADCAVCVVDDASTDETPRVVAGRYPEVRYERLERNAGFSTANNHGIRSSTAAWVVLLNNDTIPEPGFVEGMRDTWEASGAEMVAATLRMRGGEIDSAGIEVDRSLVAYDLLHGAPYDPRRIASLQPLAPCAGAGAYRRDLLLAVGGFDEAIFAYLEDVDLAIRLRMAGAACAVAPHTFAWHEHGASFGSGSARKNRLMGRSRGYLMWKYGRHLTLRERLRGHVIDLVVYGGQVVFDRNAGAVRGRLGALTARRRPVHEGFERVPRRDVAVASALRRRLGRRVTASSSSA